MPAPRAIGLTPHELAARWNKSPGTLSNWRVDGKGPPYVLDRNRVRYPLAGVIAYEREQGLGALKPA